MVLLQEKYSLWVGKLLRRREREIYKGVTLERHKRDVCSCSQNKLHHRLNWEFIVTILGKVCSVMFGY